RPAGPGRVVYQWPMGSGGRFLQVGIVNARPGVPRGRQSACAVRAARPAEPGAPRVVCFRLDGSLDLTGDDFLWIRAPGAGRTDAFRVGGEGSRVVAPPATLAADAALPDLTQLPVATIAQVPLTAAYDLLRVPALAAGGTYADPTTGIRVNKLTSATYPTASP